jgi:hypothetical protein
VSVRQLAAGYRESVDWTPLATLTSGAAFDAAAAGLVPTGDGGQDRFESALFDALSRPVQHCSTRPPLTGAPSPASPTTHMASGSRSATGT